MINKSVITYSFQTSFHSYFSPIVLNSFFVCVLFLSFLVWPLLCTHFRCKQLLLHLITLSDTHTLTHSHTHTHTHTHTHMPYISPGREIDSAQILLSDYTQHSQETSTCGIRTRSPNKQAAADLCFKTLRPPRSAVLNSIAIKCLPFCE